MSRLVSLTLAALLGVSAAKPFEVSVDAPFHEISETVLALETISRFNSSSFFPLLSVLLSDRNRKGDADHDAEVQLLFNTAEKSSFYSPNFAGVVKHDFALGSVWPFIESDMRLFESVATEETKDCPVVYWSDGEYSCDKMGLFALQTTASAKTPMLFETDHVIGTGDQWIVVYADFEHPDFPEWHATLMEMALSGKISYILRHRTPLTESGSLPVSQVAGYAVGVDLKRTDYLVIDDRKTEGELEIDLEAPSKVEEKYVPFLDFAAVKQVREHNGTEAEKLELVKELSFNFPIHAPKLVNSSNVADVETFVDNIDPYNSMGFNGLFIDGVLTKLNDPSSLFNALSEEYNTVSVLETFMPNNTEVMDVPHLLTSGLALDTEDLDSPLLASGRYDLVTGSEGVIGWMNDVETEPLYEQLQDDLTMFHQVEGPFIPVRRNMHSIVVVGDVADRATLQTVNNLMRQIGSHLPLQIGLVSNTPEWLRITPYGPESRRVFIGDLLSGKSFDQAEKHAIDAAQGELEYANDDLEEKVQDWLQRFGIQNRNEPSIFINGNLVPLNMWHDQAMPIFEADTAYLRRRDDLETIKSFRDVIYQRGKRSRNILLNPVDEISYTAWPADSLIQSFRNPEENKKNSTRHTILLSSSFQNTVPFNLADTILKRSMDNNDVDLYIRPMRGIDERFYASLLDPTYNMFRFSRDLMQAARGHLFQNKTEPRVFTVAKEPEISADKLARDTVDSVIIDGRLIPLREFVQYEDSDEISLDELIDGLLSREEPRVERLQKNVEGISGIAIAAITSTAQKRTMITENDKPDIYFEGPRESIILTFVVDPASPSGQELISLADLAIKSNQTVQIFLSPTELSSVPNRIFRSVTDRHNPIAEFNNLSEDVLYSAEIIEPPAWVTMTKACDYDLSNILLNQVKEDKLSAVYSLHSLLIEGYAPGNDSPGQQLDLYNSDGVKIADTMIMANLGYFQFQTPTPGVYKICVADKKYSISPLGTGETVDCIDVSVSSFSGQQVRLNVVHKAPTRTNKKAVGASTEKGGLWGKMSGLLNNKGIGKRNADADADINIFTVASGHLYERFASIMTLSVMRHTGHTVKFWFIENFLSPKFKELLPALAEENGFKYEFISYKWPTWLRSQTEKQRQIWGYKILFLDVLFPQTLSNVIFVDSDQIVRTDFQDLLDIDLKGAPYAFTPMGDDREEMESFRFWKQGTWDRYLSPKNYKYHISALYRVDLNRFREAKVGDIIRQQYQRLSSDPANLANLDQDLPNSLQHIVPIYTLPEEWLWCETWCSDEGLSFARTIDLCNNPLTKEPKLDRARRQIPEWVEYDEIVAKLQASVDEQKASEKQASSSKPAPVSTPLGDHPNEHKFDDEEEDDTHDEL